jgi:hypothetical protein
LAGNQDIRFNPGNFIEEPLGTWVEKVLGRLPVWKRVWFPLRAAASESTCASCGRGQRFNRVERHPLDSCDDHLGDAHAARYLKFLGTEIDQRHHQLAAVVAVDRSRGIRQRDTVPECQAGPWPELAFIPVWNGDAEAGPEELSLEGGQLTVFRAG